jgi:hypothetical protein
MSKDVVSDPKSYIMIKNIRGLDKRFREFILVNKEVRCSECGRNFGKLENDFLNPILKKHLCNWKGYR